MASEDGIKGAPSSLAVCMVVVTVHIYVPSPGIDVTVNVILQLISIYLVLHIRSSTKSVHEDQYCRVMVMCKL